MPTLFFAYPDEEKETAMGRRRTRWTEGRGANLMLVAIAGSFWWAAVFPLYRM